MAAVGAGAAGLGVTTAWLPVVGAAAGFLAALATFSKDSMTRRTSLALGAEAAEEAAGFGAAAAFGADAGFGAAAGGLPPGAALFG
ncbi:MAG: hypothetical protein Kilf2KO_04570 [Rhodospirillales bacterium]